MDLMGKPGAEVRMFAMWSTSSTIGNEVASGGTPVAELFGGHQYSRWYWAALDKAPCVAVRRSLAVGDTTLASSGSIISLQQAEAFLFTLPFGGAVAGLAIDVDPDGDATTVQQVVLSLFEDLDRDRENLLLGGESILEACCRGSHVDPTCLELGGDFHGVTMLKEGKISSDLELDKHELTKFVSRKSGPNRPEFLSARFPRDPNRFTDTAAAVTPGATVLVGQPPVISLCHVLSVVQALAAISALRQIQHRGYAALREFRSDAETGRAWLTERSSELGNLEVDLSFGVEAYLDMRLMVPVLPVEQLHQDLVDSIALERSSQVTSLLISRLQSALFAERDRISGMEADQGRARRVAGAVAVGLAGLVALPLTFLGANVEEVDKSKSMFDLGHYWTPYLGIVGFFVLIMTVVWIIVRRDGGR